MGRFQDADSYFDSYFRLETSGMPLPCNFTYSSTLTDVRLPLSLVWRAKRTWRKPSHPLPSTRNMKEGGQPHPQKQRGRLVTGALLMSDKVRTLTRRKPLAVGKISQQIHLFWASCHRFSISIGFALYGGTTNDITVLIKANQMILCTVKGVLTLLQLHPHTMSFPKPKVLFISLWHGRVSKRFVNI